MKTSFYFVVWIAIYPILELLNSSFVDNNSFIIALFLVWGLAMLINRLMPRIIGYERVSQTADILEDVYTGNVASFSRRLGRETTIEIVTGVYFLVTTMVLIFAVINGGMNDWIGLLIFGLFAFGAISRSNILFKAKTSLRANPTPEQCREIAEETYKLDYATYYEARKDRDFSAMIPPQPRHIKAYRIFSIVMAAIAAILGTCFIVLGIIMMITSGSGLGLGAVAGMYFLYGSLAAYFGIRDIITSARSLASRPKR